MPSSSWLSSSSLALVTSLSPRDLKDPLVFSKDFGPVANWYKDHKNLKGSSSISRIQLRKDFRPPAHHEYVVIFTQSGHAYRVDRSRDPESEELVFGAIMEDGVTPQDTIALVHSWKELDKTSYCVIELQWGSDKTIDLKLILDVCYQIHNDSGNRYKLLTHNCYFFAQTILMIAVRKTVVCTVEWDKALKGGMSEITEEFCWELFRKEAGVSDSLWSLGWKFGRALGEKFGRDLASHVGGKLGNQLGGRLGHELSSKLCQDLGRDLGHDLERAQRWERWVELYRQKLRWHLQSEKKRIWDEDLTQDLEERWKLLHEWDREKLGERLRKLQQWELKLDRDLKLALELAQESLAEVLDWAFKGELAPDWHKSDTLVRTVPSKVACTWARWLVEKLGMIVARMVGEQPFFVTSFSEVIEFPASFSATSRIEPKDSVAPIRTYKDLEECMKAIIERHVTSVPLSTVGLKHELKADILKGMKLTWRLMFPQLMHDLNHFRFYLT